MNSMLAASRGTASRQAAALLSSTTRRYTRPSLPLLDSAKDYPHRGVARVDAFHATPSKSSNTETMMPWNGWFSSLLESKLGSEKYQKLRSLLLWKPDDEHDLMQIPYPTTKVEVEKDRKVMFRHPSPGNQPPVRQPETADPGTYGDDPYNITYYPMDTTRRGQDPAFTDPNIKKMQLELLDKDDPRVAQVKEQLELGPGSSPGNKGTFTTGKSTFDTTDGLRASMSTSNEAMYAQLDRSMPNHLPKPAWKKREAEWIAWHEERGLDLPAGAYGDSKMSTNRRIARW